MLIPVVPEDRTVVQLLAELQVDVPFGVETGRIAAGTNANPQSPGEEPNALSRNHKRLADLASESPPGTGPR
jgi:hypothetical protein